MPRLKKKKAESTPIDNLISFYKSMLPKAKDIIETIAIEEFISRLELYKALERKHLEDAFVEGQIHIINIVSSFLGKENFKDSYDDYENHKNGDRDENAIKFFDDKYVK